MIIHINYTTTTANNDNHDNNDHTTTTKHTTTTTTNNLYYCLPAIREDCDEGMRLSQLRLRSV